MAIHCWAMFWPGNILLLVHKISPANFSSLHLSLLFLQVSFPPGKSITSVLLIVFFFAMAPRSTQLTADVDFPFLVALVLFSQVLPEPEMDEDNNIPYVEEPRMYFTSLSAKARQHNVGDVINSKYIVLLSFWLDTCPSPVHTLDIPIPLSWSPHTYLAALQMSIQIRGTVIVSPDNFVWPLAPTLNEVHWLFNLDIEVALHILEIRNAFGVVNGGECFVIPT